MDAHSPWWLIAVALGIGALVLMDADRRDKKERAKARRHADDNARREAMQDRWNSLALRLKAKGTHVTVRKDYKPAVTHIAPAKAGVILPLRKRA